MDRLSDNYYHRECYFKRNQVPTQTVMIKKMSPPLAKVYFSSMNSKLKVLAGLEPPMQGGGSDWYMPPKDLLLGRAVMKPEKKEYLSKLGFDGIDMIGEKIVEKHHREMEEEIERALKESDDMWKKKIQLCCSEQREETALEAAKQNTQRIQQAFREFTALYVTSITNIESLLYDASVKEIEKVKDETYLKMKQKYEDLMEKQAIMLYERYIKKLDAEKARLKAQFIDNVENARTEMFQQVHDINVEKHVAIEKLRHLLECQNMACQVYVALKEREECKKEMELSKHKHKKKVKTLTEQIAMKDFEIRLEIEKEKKRQEFNKIWQQKVCHVVRKFQMFVSYCLEVLPEHAEFFINMEKLMLLQLNEALEDPTVESAIEPEAPEFHTPIPNPHPFYLCCDKGFKPDIDRELCPPHYTASAEQLPVIIINKRCIYSACDTFDKFTDKITDFIKGQRGNDNDVADNRDYKYDVPVKYTDSQKLLELKLESSLMQVLQQELPNVRQVPIECCVCKIPYCFCSPLHASSMSLRAPEPFIEPVSEESIDSGKKMETRRDELAHEREPKWESYLRYVEPQKCRCAKTAKKHLLEHLPPYMRTMSKFATPQLPNYEPCTVATLKKLVKKARGKITPPPEPEPPEPTSRDMETQYADQEYDFLCTCFSDAEIERLFEKLTRDSTVIGTTTESRFQVVGNEVPPSHLQKTPSAFATEMAFSLRGILDKEPELEEIFKKEVCDTSKKTPQIHEFSV